MILDHQLLRLVLAHYMGQTLTPEIANKIEDVAMHAEDRSHDPALFGRVVKGDYTFQVERLADILDEIHALSEAHYLESELPKQGIPLAPDYKHMLRCERDGALVQFTARCGPELVANLRMYVTISLHSQTAFAHFAPVLPSASEDTLYVKAGHRGGWVGMHILDFMEKSLRQVLGIRKFTGDIKTLNGADVLLRRRRYEHVSSRYVKIVQ